MSIEVDEYLERGITPDTWTCVSVGDIKDAKTYVWDLAVSGIPALVSQDADGKRWHVAVQGGLKNNPLAWLVSIRGSDDDRIAHCPSFASGQHPQATHGG